MKPLSSLSFLAKVLLAGALVAPPLMVQNVLAQAPVATLDQQDFEKGMAASDANNLKEAASYFEGIPVKYPTSPLIPQASVRLGYIYFRLQQYDQAVKTLAGVAALKNVTPEITELAASLTPQVLSAKAVAGGPKDPQRKRLFDDAIKGFDAFIAKYPASDDVESANYGKAVALYQTERYDEAMAALRINLTRPIKSESILDSQFLMALTMGTVANAGAIKQAAADGKPDPAVQKGYENAELMLTDIVTKGTDVAMANDSRFQIGELLFARANFTKDEKLRTALFQRALEVYRVVGAKELVVAAQKSRVERLKAMETPARQRNDQALLKRIKRQTDKEQEKLANIEGRPDQTIAARVKMGEVFLHLEKLDEARMIFNFMKPLLEDEEQKKAVGYQIAVTLAEQNKDTHGSVPALAERAEAAYNEFKTAYSNDPIAENLPLLLLAGFSSSSPEKATAYYEVLKKDYPKTSYLSIAEGALAAAKIQQGDFAAAQALYKNTLAGNPDKATAARAEFGLATIMQKQKDPGAIALFKKVRDTYPGTAEATNSSFYYPQLLLESGDSKAALPELQAFVKNNSKSELLSTALFFLGQAQANTGLRSEALVTYKRVADEFPGKEVTPYTYFMRAAILQQDSKSDEVITLMREFMDKFPDKDTLYQAYDFVAQIQVAATKKADAIETYEKFAKLKPQDPMSAQALLRVGTLWKELAEAPGRWYTLTPDQQTVWKKNVDDSIDAAERLIRQHSDAPQVALALALILDDFKLRIGAKLATDSDTEKFLQKLSEEFKDKPSTRSKIIFTLAGTLMEKDKKKALELMAGVYDSSLKYAPEDMDLYGTGLVEEKKYDEAEKLFKKLADDYPNPPANPDPMKAPRDIQEAQSMSLYGLGKILQDQGKAVEAKVKFDELERLYGWSPKMLAAHYGIALALFEEKKYDEALERLKKIANAPKAPSELRAKAMFLIARCQEEKGNFDEAINNFVKISSFYASVPKVASEGLWRGAQLLEKQASGEIAIPTPPPRATPQKKPAPGAPGSPAPAGEAVAANAPATAK